MFWIIISIIVGLIIGVIYFYSMCHVDAYFTGEGSWDIEPLDFLKSFLITILSFVFTFLISMVPQLYIVGITNPTEFKSVSYTYKTSIDVGNIKQVPEGLVFIDKNTEAEKIVIPNTINLIQWDKQNIQLFHVNATIDNFFSIFNEYNVYCLYVPKDKYEDISQMYGITTKLDKSFLDIDNLLNEYNNYIESIDTDIFDENIKDMDITSSNEYTQELVESKPIFKYDFNGNYYTVRCNDGTIISINKNVIEIKESKDSIKYIDKNLNTYKDINGNWVSIYMYVLYK